MKVTRSILTIIAVIIFSGLINAQVTLTLPTTSGIVDNTISANVTVNDITSLNIKSFQFQVNYDPAIIEILSVTNSGTMSAAASPQYATPAAGKFRVAWASSGALTGSGTLIKLNIKIKGSGTSALSYTASDGFFNSEFASGTGTVYTVTPVDGAVTGSTENHAPTLEMNPAGPDFEVNGGELLTINLSGTDSDAGDVLTYSFTSTPTATGAQINASTGAFTWTPTDEQSGEYNVTFAVSDTKATTTLNATITVIGANVAPTLTLEPAGPSFNVDEGEEITLVLVGADINPGDQENLVYSVLNKPAGSILTGNIFTWTPSYTQGSDDPYYMTFMVMDPAGLTASVIVTITVKNINRAPSFTKVIPDTTIKVHTAPTPVYYSFQYQAEDPDGDDLIFGFISGPDGSGITTEGLFTWAPTVEQAGKTFTVSILVSDGKLSQITNSTISTESTITGVDGEDFLPGEFKLYQNYPNPFNPTTVISFNVPKDGNVKLSLYNVIGEEVGLLLNGYRSAGFYTVNFDASKLNSGVYIYKLEADGFTAVKKMVVEK